MSLKSTLVKTLKEYVILEKLKDDFDVEPAKREDVEVFIQRHYLKKFPTGIKRIYAIYQKHTEGRHMVGMIIYGIPFMTAGKFLEPEVNSREVLELKRLYIDDIGVKNLESFVISQSLSLLKQDEPTIKVVLTFADDLQGHIGGIYQATNAIYLGKSESGKHKYVYILRGNLNAIKDKLKPFIQPYPKKEIPIEPITENEEKYLTPAEEETYDELVDKFLRTINQAFSEVSPNENGITRDQLVIRLHFVANNDDFALRLGNDPSIKSTGARNWFKEGKFIEQTLIKLGTDKKEIEALYCLMRRNVGNRQQENKLPLTECSCGIIKLKELITEVSKEDFLKSLNRVGELSPIQIAMKSRIKSRIEYARIRKDHINRGKCIHDENDAYEYSNKKKSLLCKECIETRYEPKRRKALFNRICPHCLTYNLYYIPRDDRMSTLCRSCDKRRVGRII